jgi:hypothetical protein
VYEENDGLVTVQSILVVVGFQATVTPAGGVRQEG